MQRSSIKNYSEESEKKIYDVKVLHVTEIKDYVLRQLIRILPFQPSLKNPSYTIETRSERNQRYYDEPENKCNSMVQQKKKSQQVFNKAKIYRLKPLLKRALKRMPSFPHHQRTFEYYNICIYLAKYIISFMVFIEPKHTLIGIYK